MAKCQTLPKDLFRKSSGSQNSAGDAKSVSDHREVTQETPVNRRPNVAGM